MNFLPCRLNPAVAVSHSVKTSHNSKVNSNYLLPELLQWGMQMPGHLGKQNTACNNRTQAVTHTHTTYKRWLQTNTQPTSSHNAVSELVTRHPQRHNGTANMSTQKLQSYREDASSRPVEGDTIHGWQVSQDSLVHLHVLVYSSGNQLPEAVGAVQSTAVARLHCVDKKQHPINDKWTRTVFIPRTK